MKRVYVLTLAFMALGCFPVFAQVDRYWLAEIGRIEAPAEIVELRVEDLDGDSLKEIILTTPSNIHIYNGITYEEIWISPDLSGLNKLALADYNNDELTDVSVKSGWNGGLYVYDPHDSTTIVSITDLEHPIYCYTGGDRNGDGFQDIIISTHYDFPAGPGYDGYDTTWTHVYDGPDFQLVYTFDPIITLRRQWYESNPPVNINVNQDPSSVILVDLVADEDPRDTVIMVHMNSWNRVNSSLSYGGYSIWYDGLTFDSTKTSTAGHERQCKVLWYQGLKFDYVLTEACNHNDFYHHEWDFLHYYSRSYSGTLLLYEEVEPSIWGRSYLVDDITSSFDYHEYILSRHNDITLYSISTGQIIWNQYYNGVGGPFDKVSSPTLFDHPQIRFGYGIVGQDCFLDAENGALTGRLYVHTDRNLPADANNDGEDEIYSIQDNQLIISNVQPLTAIQDHDIEFPDNISVNNYPNPFNSATTIEYGLPEAGHVTISIYDLLGRRIETLLQGRQPAGYHQVTWDAESQSSGVYFCSIQAGEFAETRKMVLLK